MPGVKAPATLAVTAVVPPPAFNLRAKLLGTEEVVVNVTFHYFFVVFVAGIFQ